MDTFNVFLLFFSLFETLGCHGLPLYQHWVELLHPRNSRMLRRWENVSRASIDTQLKMGGNLIFGWTVPLSTEATSADRLQHVPSEPVYRLPLQFAPCISLKARCWMQTVTCAESWSRLWAAPHLGQILGPDCVSHISQSAAEWVMYVHVLGCEYAHERSDACYTSVCCECLCVRGAGGTWSGPESKREKRQRAAERREVM